MLIKPQSLLLLTLPALSVACAGSHKTSQGPSQPPPALPSGPTAAEVAPPVVANAPTTPPPAAQPAAAPVAAAAPTQAPHDAGAYVSQAQSELASGANDVAIKTAMQALQMDDRDAAAMAVIAQAEYNEGKVDLARYALDQALTVDPRNADANNLYGFIDPSRQDLASDQERLDAAVKHFKAATDARPDFAAAWNNLGATYLKQKHYDDARTALERAVQIRPNWSVAQMNLGSAYRGLALTSTDPSQRDSLLQQAEQRFQQAGALDPQNADVHYNLGILYLDADPFPGLAKLDRLQKAIDELSRYQQLMGPRLTADDPTAAPDGGFLADARAQLAHEQKEQAKKNKKKHSESGDSQGTPAAPGAAGAQGG